MNSSYQIDPSVLITAAHVYAALHIIPRISGSKETWALWMRENFDRELVSEPHSSVINDRYIFRTIFPELHSPPHNPRFWGA